MRILFAALIVMFSALVGVSARAADLPSFSPPAPEVDYGLQGGFYLRGSVGINVLWTQEHIGTTGLSLPPTGAGYGYSVGAGAGYEFGNGFRVDGTFDYLSNDGLTDGTNVLHLRAGVALANAYYDFPISGSSAAGGFGAYVGAGAGLALYKVSVTPTDPTLPDGSGWTPAAAAMAGVTYDMGNWVADLGYRMIYMPKISNYALAPQTSWYINDNTVSEIRASVRYRLN
jgi:Outer membrane protein beta-barrel domain